VVAVDVRSHEVTNAEGADVSFLAPSVF
jgi:hypothetical protein